MSGAGSVKERFGFVLMVAGVGFFLVGFLFQMFGPLVVLDQIPRKSVQELAESARLDNFEKLAEDYPDEFRAAFGEPNTQAFAEALRLGRDIYVAEGCWHCHSQFVRPIANEPVRYGAVSVASEYQNELQMPVLFGTRRVGPDLTREAGVHSNDWHVAHFFDPPSVQPGSVMPSYRWFYDAKGRPNRRGLAIVTYVQWLGSWERSGDDATAAH